MDSCDLFERPFKESGDSKESENKATCSSCYQTATLLARVKANLTRVKCMKSYSRKKYNYFSNALEVKFKLKRRPVKPLFEEKKEHKYEQNILQLVHDYNSCVTIQTFFIISFINNMFVKKQ